MEEKMTVTLLPARKKASLAKRDEENSKLRVAAYCRVSTDSDEQETSYDAQITHYTAYINSHPDWELAGIYADDGISGTNTKKDNKSKDSNEWLIYDVDLVGVSIIQTYRQQFAGILKEKTFDEMFEQFKNQ